jgi:hypothetical protein
MKFENQMQEKPKDLTSLEYARHILEEVLGWPAKGNIELIADCITSVSKSRQIDLPRAHGYLERAIRLAKEQSVTVDRWFFQHGIYTSMRPKTEMATYRPYDRKKTAEEQSHPEWEEERQKMGRLIKSFTRGNKMSEAK